jgi:pantoate--beta-alanine ligase
MGRRLRHNAAIAANRMRIARSAEDLRYHVAALRLDAVSLALVPTMGALHAGHLSLLAAARREADAVMASIFVNPTQFGPGDGLERYPRNEPDDLAALQAAGCDLAWLPSCEAMYPPGSATTIDVRDVSERWEGAARPHHFRGVATVCAKLFAQTGADLAVFGEKDWQQVQVVRRMVRDLDLPIRIVSAPTVREPDGLAMSSRNRFLTALERNAAAALPRILCEAAGELARGTRASPLLDRAVRSLRSSGLQPDYVALVHAETLHPLNEAPIGEVARLIAAARIGSVRLLDNWAVNRRSSDG